MGEEKPGITVKELRARLKGTGWVLVLWGDCSEAEKHVKRGEYLYDTIKVIRDTGPEARLRLAEIVEKLETEK